MNASATRLAAASILLLASGSAPAPGGELSTATEAAPLAYARLLETYARPEGVRYAAWHANSADRAAMEEAAGFYANTLPPVDRAASLAWHLNAYNAWILNSILKKYPAEGPLDREPHFFQTNRIMISGAQTSFDRFETDMIRSAFQEPRIHFALNCASESCPPLHTRPFAAATLAADLDRLVRAFVNTNPNGVVLKGGEVKLSRIFDWYAADFGGKENLLPFINRYRETPIPDGASVRFLEYSWRLNESR